MADQIEKSQFAGQNFYELLGVDRKASKKEITKAYRKLALRVHPDRHKQSEQATADFQALTIIYQTLTNERKRKLYDANGTVDETTSKSFEEAYEKYRSVFKEITKTDIDVFTPELGFLL